MGSIADYDQLKLKQTNASDHLVQYRLRSMKAVRKEPGRLWMKGFVKEMSYKSGRSRE